MYDFVIQMSAVVGLAIVVYMLARALPRLSENGMSSPQNNFDRFIARLPLARIDEALHLFFERVLRKCKIIIMKFDFLVSGYQNRMKQYAAAKESKADLKEKMEVMTNGNNIDIQKPAK